MPEVPEYVVEAFWAFCEGIQENHGDSPAFDSVEEYIECWVDERAAYHHCVGDFRIFMSVVAYIFAQWHDRRAECKNEADWHTPIHWQVNRALKGDKRVGTEIFNPLYFQYHCP